MTFVACIAVFVGTLVSIALGFHLRGLVPPPQPTGECRETVVVTPASDTERFTSATVSPTPPKKEEPPTVDAEELKGWRTKEGETFHVLNGTQVAGYIPDEYRLTDAFFTELRSELDDAG